MSQPNPNHRFGANLLLCAALLVIFSVGGCDKKDSPGASGTATQTPDQPAVSSEEAERQMAEYDRQIDEALKTYQPTSNKVLELRKAQEDYCVRVAPQLLQILDVRQAELDAMAKDMRPTAAPLLAKRAQVDVLRRQCKPAIVAQLVGVIKANQDKGSPQVRDAVIELLSLDPQNAAAPDWAALIATTNSVGMRFAYIPAGEFVMGSPANEQGRRGNEVQHKVKITKPFYMQTTPVTQAQWKAVMGSDPSTTLGDDLPVNSCSWKRAAQFCRRLSEVEGKAYRLPTEAEWEYACRAGTSTTYYSGDGEAALAQVGWYKANSASSKRSPATAPSSDPHPVGQKKPNGWGLYDMHGNVQQWCSDGFADYPNGDAIDPEGPQSSENRVLRGGELLSKVVDERI